MINNVVFMGRLTADAELRKTQSGKSVTRFSVANDAGYGDNKRTNFIDVVAWGKTAEFVCNYFSKGSMIAIRGEIQTGSYEKDGVKRKTVEINAQEVSFCGGKEEKPETMFSNGKVDFEDVPIDVDLEDSLPF